MKLPDEKTLPEDIRKVWMAAYDQSKLEGNSDVTCRMIAWSAVRNRFRKNDKGDWAAVQAEQNLAVKTLDDNLAIGTLKMNQDGTYPIHIASVGEVVTLQEAEGWLRNYESKAYMQEAPLVAEHPFDPDNRKDGRARGWLKKLYLKGSEVWGDFQLTPRGLQEIADREFLYVSPGWFPKYKHKVTGETVENVLFEVSLTNIPAQKWLNKVVELAGIAPDAEEENWEELYNRVEADLKKVLEKFRNKTGNAGRRMRINELLRDILGKLKTENVDSKPPSSAGAFEFKEETEDANMKTAEEQVQELKAQLAEKNKEIAAITAEAKEKEQKAKSLEERVMTLEEQRFESEIRALMDSYLPQPNKDSFKILKAEEAKFMDLARRFNKDAEGMNVFKAFLESLPVVKLDTSVKGVSGILPGKDEDDEKPEDKEKKAMSKAKKDPEWAKIEKREEIYERYLSEEGK